MDCGCPKSLRRAAVIFPHFVWPAQCRAIFQIYLRCNLNSCIKEEIFQQEDKLNKVVMPKMENNGLLQSVDASKCLDKKIYKDQDTLLKVKEESKIIFVNY